MPRTIQNAVTDGGYLTAVSGAPQGSQERAPLEIWGGIECTVNRVGDVYFDQVERSGHATRLSDLDLFSDLGLRRLRYPVLWERIAPQDPARYDWSWTDERLQRLRQLGIPPIVGLVHHGSGPHYTSLLDPGFPEGLARFARAVAQRYPWVESYTPVNEPLTTARFSALYGHWYPHQRNGLSFARALLSQCRAVVLAMHAIREVTPTAQLVQTDDLGKTYSTLELGYQADFENERRWVTYDLLCGRVDRDHRLWQFLQWLGVEQAELTWFLENSCPPDVVGINHYVTSERFLDGRLERYPAHTHGGNGRDAYADVEAVRACASEPGGLGGLLHEAWERYRLPIAVTEAHLGGTRENQLRWLQDVWRAAHQARHRGANVCAVTVWSLLGAFDWDSLVTRNAGHYEAAAFDVTGPLPRPTALAGLVRDLAAGRESHHPVLAVPGWWRRTEKRLLYPPVPDHQVHGYRAATRSAQVVPELEHASEPVWQPQDDRSGPSAPPARPLVITGATGTLGRAFARLCDHRGLPYRLLSRRALDISDAASVDAALEQLQPWAVVNAAGFVRVDNAEREPEACFRANTHGPEVLATACARRHVALLTFSSDLVFDGARRTPYVEHDAPGPLNVYGRSKAEMETRVLECLPSALVVRTSAFFSPWDTYNFVTVALQQLRGGLPFTAADDAVVSPTYVPDLVHACLDLVIDGEQGLWHLANSGAVTWFTLAERAAELAGVDTSCLEGRPTAALGFVAPRPVYSALASERGTLLPSLEEALTHYLHDAGGPS